MNRSYLFVPAHREKLVSKAHERGADAIILDLEDGVPDEEKEAARSALPDSASRLAASSQPLIVRVNATLTQCARDIEAALAAGVKRLMIPKAESSGQLVWIDQCLNELELRAERPLGSVTLIPLIETPQALLNAKEIAKASPRMEALAFGSEDFSLACGHEPSRDALTAPFQHLILAAKSAGIQAIGVPDSIALIADLERFKTAIDLGKRLGSDGVLCIHPKQVTEVNKAYQPSRAEIDHALEMIDIFEKAQAQGLGAVMFKGEMIDPPVIKRAQAIVRQISRQKTPA